jgi:hypothetical protein
MATYSSNQTIKKIYLLFLPYKYFTYVQNTHILFPFWCSLKRDSTLLVPLRTARLSSQLVGRRLFTFDRSPPLQLEPLLHD